jgi:hypothetical protein
VPIKIAAVATRETRFQRGRRHGLALVRRTIRELRDARVLAGISHDQMGKELGGSGSAYGRFETFQLDDVGLVRLAEIASLLGYEVSLGLHPIGEPIRDKGQRACASRFDALLSDRWRVTDEALLPGPGQQRAWDKLLRLIDSSPPYLVGTDIESRVHDIQAIVRRTRARERDGNVDHILIVLADTAHNRRVFDELVRSLGDACTTPSRDIVTALRAGTPLPGSGVVLV